MRIGLISNGRSRRNRRSLADLHAVAASRREVTEFVLDGVDDLPGALGQLAGRGVELIAVNGGDGTVQAVLTELLAAQPFAQLPLLALLPGGTTNMTAADVGLRGRRDRALVRLLDTAGEGMLQRHTVERDVMRVDGVPGGPLYGMFFGTAAIHRAILFCRWEVHPMRLSAGAASALTLAGLLVRAASGRDDRVLRGDPIGLRVDNGPLERRDRLLLLVTTLDRLVLRSRPFWGTGAGSLRYLAIDHPAPRLLRSAIRVLYGGPERRLPPGYRSGPAHAISLELDCPFTVDGELFEPLPGHPIRLTGGHPVRFVRC